MGVPVSHHQSTRPRRRLFPRRRRGRQRARARLRASPTVPALLDRASPSRLAVTRVTPRVPPVMLVTPSGESHTPLAASGKQQNAVCGARPPAAPSQAARPEPRPIPVRPPIIVAPCTLNLVHTHVPRARRAEREPSNSAAACDAGGQSPRFFAAHPPPVPAAPRPLSPLLVSASFARSRRPFWQRIACPSSC